MMSSMLYHDRKVIAICGDGGFMMKRRGMESGVRRGGSGGGGGVGGWA